MKKLFLAMALVGATSASVVKADRNNPTSAELVQAQVSAENAILALLRHQRGKNLITWQVGEFQKFKVQFLLWGSLNKEVIREEEYQGEAAVWLRQNSTLLGQASVIEQLLARGDARVLRQIVDGQEQTPSTDPGTVEIIEQVETIAEVPAGRFECLYTKANITQDGQTQQIEMWQNPLEVNMGGMVKSIVQSALGPMTMSLKDFGPRN